MDNFHCCCKGSGRNDGRRPRVVAFTTVKLCHARCYLERSQNSDGFLKDICSLPLVCTLWTFSFSFSFCANALLALSYADNADASCSFLAAAAACCLSLFLFSFSSCSRLAFAACFCFL